jgi:hypothetical protein
MKFLAIFTTSFLLVFSGLTANEDFNRFLKLIDNDILITRITSIIEILENTPNIRSDYLYNDREFQRHELQKKTITTSLSCQLAIELNSLKKRIFESLPRHQKQIEEDKQSIGEIENIQDVQSKLSSIDDLEKYIERQKFILNYIEVLKQKHCAWVVELEEM